MAQYGLYSGVDTGSIQSAAESLKAKISSSKNELETHQGSINEDIWKAGSRQTLLDGYNKLTSEVYPEIEKKLDNVIEVCSQIEVYKEAEKEALNCQNVLAQNNITDESRASANQNLSSNERTMETCENTISSICGG